MKAKLVGFQPMSFEDEKGGKIEGVTCYFLKETPTPGVEGNSCFRSFVGSKILTEKDCFVGGCYDLDFVPAASGKARLESCVYVG